MNQQIATLGSQLGKQNELVSAYAQASKQPFGFVLLDLCTNTPDHYRIRSDTFEETENRTTVLQQVDSVQPICSAKLQTKQIVQVKTMATQTLTQSPKNSWMKLNDAVTDGSNRKKIKRRQMKLLNQPSKLKSSDSWNPVNHFNSFTV